MRIASCLVRNLHSRTISTSTSAASASASAAASRRAVVVGRERAAIIAAHRRSYTTHSQLPSEHQMVYEMCRKFADEKLSPNAGRWDKEHAFPTEAVDKLVRARASFFLIVVFFFLVLLFFGGGGPGVGLREGDEGREGEVGGGR